MILFISSKQRDNVKHINKFMGNISFIFIKKITNQYVVEMILFIYSKQCENVKHLNKLKILFIFRRNTSFNHPTKL